MNINYTVILEWDAETRRYGVTFPDLPMVFSQGDTEVEACANAREALTLWFETELTKNGVQAPHTRPREIDVSDGSLVRTVSPERRVAVAAWIRFQREARRWTQSDVAARLGISQQAYRRFEHPESANPRLSTLIELEAVFEDQVLAV